MASTIDATGRACPIPFMLAKKEIDGGNTSFSVLVDNTLAVENLKKLARAEGFKTTVSPGEAPYTVTFDSTAEHRQTSRQEKREEQSYLVYLGSDTMGNGEHELGRNLLRMFLYTIDQGDALPDTIICLNKGVFMATEDAHAIATLRSLSAKGVSIISCGTCLDYYHLTEKLHVGSIGNMHEIANKLVHAKHIVKP